MRVNRREIKRLCSEGPTMDFRLKGACLGGGIKAFFQPKAVEGGDDRAAKAICSTCKVREECLAWAICHEKFGVWGGTSEAQRRNLRRELGVKYTAIETMYQRPPCGTDAAFEYHRRHGEETCKACRAAHSRRIASNWGMTSRDYLVNAERRKGRAS